MTKKTYSRKADQPENWRKRERLLSPSERDHLKYLQLMSQSSGTQQSSLNTSIEPSLTSGAE